MGLMARLHSGAIKTGKCDLDQGVRKMRHSGDLSTVGLKEAGITPPTSSGPGHQELLECAEWGGTVRPLGDSQIFGLSKSPVRKDGKMQFYPAEQQETLRKADSQAPVTGGEKSSLFRAGSGHCLATNVIVSFIGHFRLSNQPYIFPPVSQIKLG